MPCPGTKPTVLRPCTPRNSNRSRAVTALSLHADTVHLTGNLVFGLVFGFLAGELLALEARVVRMAARGSAFVQAPGHKSIGASTAVFATLDILAAYTWKRRRSQINRWVPLGGGVAFLAFLEMGGERHELTDAEYDDYVRMSFAAIDYR